MNKKHRAIIHFPTMDRDALAMKAMVATIRNMHSPQYFDAIMRAAAAESLTAQHYIARIAYAQADAMIIVSKGRK